MPKRIVNSTIVLHREGKPVVPRVGEVFDFTPEEVTNINKVNPSALGRVIADEPAAIMAKADVKGG